MSTFTALDLTVEEAFKSLTGFQSIAIRQTFGKPVQELDNLLMVYALLMCHSGRSYEEVMKLSISEVDALFKAEDEDPFRGKA
ncbi:hypothetical protein [Actinoplanes derwentensis]|uniref:Uncharacterized protein n=1 Tax=Actinoplanes derwentensis TaxID=113562 RepID=A0A1H1V3E9_9ACTN|nr:hypothetical protein [Actinoplanes derwentensis]GID90512.1 hypothetical protein Ade03nite_94360 [Actinoplanes derwentensis]SDS79304.1 hypothetical protein SAMN04489716_1629 [Actinoplanes derwentensis]